MKRTATILMTLLLALQTAANGRQPDTPPIREDSISMPMTLDSVPMTLNDCLLYAREHAHSNRLSRLDTEKAAAEKRIGAADLMPYVGLGSSASLSFGRNIDPETNTYDNKRTLGTGFGLDLSLPLFDGLVRINNLKALKTAELRAKKDNAVEEDRVSLEVIKSFYKVSYCKAMVEQMSRQLHRDSLDLAATQRGEQLGTKSGADIAELEAIVAADLYELTNQQNLLKKAYLSLRSSMGLTLNEEPVILNDGIIADQADIPYGREDNATLSRRLPDIEAAELTVRESRHYLNAAKGGYSPRLSFSAGINTSYYRMMGLPTEIPSFRRQLRDNMGEYLSLSFSFPIFDGLATANRVKKAKINLRYSEMKLEETIYKLQEATEEAQLDREGAIEELTSAKRRLDAEQIAYKAMRRKYELGMASAIDLYTSSSKLATAEANLVGKRIQRIIAEITLSYYQGYPLIRE